MMCQHFLRNIPLKPSEPRALSTGILLTALSISSLVNGTEIQSRPSCWDTNCIEIARRIREWLHLKQHEFHPILIGVFTAIIVIIRFILIHDEWSVHWNEVNKRISYQHGYENFLNISLFKSISMDYRLHVTLVSIPTMPHSSSSPSRSFILQSALELPAAAERTSTVSLVVTL